MSKFLQKNVINRYKDVIIVLFEVFIYLGVIFAIYKMLYSILVQEYATDAVKKAYAFYKKEYKYSKFQFCIRLSKIPTKNQALIIQQQYIDTIGLGFDCSIDFRAIGGDNLFTIDHLTRFYKKAIDKAKEKNTIIILSAPEEKNYYMAESIKNNILDYALKIDYRNLYLPFQVYRKECLKNIKLLLQKYGNFFGIRLIKGVYRNEDGNKAAIQNDPNKTINDYIEIAKYLHYKKIRVFYATHDEYIRKNIITNKLYDGNLNSFEMFNFISSSIGEEKFNFNMYNVNYGVSYMLNDKMIIDNKLMEEKYKNYNSNVMILTKPIYMYLILDNDNISSKMTNTIFTDAFFKNIT